MQLLCIYGTVCCLRYALSYPRKAEMIKGTRSRPRAIAVLILGLLILAGCATQQVAPVAEPFGLEGLVELPATFSGHIPCDDCDRVDIVLNLRPDSLYQLRKTYQAEQGVVKVEAQMGLWRFSPDGNLLILGKQKGLLKTYVVTGNDELRFLEWEGTDNKGQIRYSLVRSDTLDPFEDVVKIRGMFLAGDGNAQLSECVSGVSFEVNRDGEFATTLQNYLNTPHDYEEPMLLSILGSVQTGFDPQTDRDSITIDQFRRFYPNRDCEGNTVKAGLTGTYWQLSEIDGMAVTQQDEQEMVYLLFNADKSLSGYGGCNRINGTYLIKGDVFLFNRGDMTRMACRGDMDIENRLLTILDEAETYRIEGTMLTLLDQNEKVRARFQAGP